MRTLTALRGLWLIVLELTIVGFAWSFTPGHSVAGVIWSLGCAMLFVAALSALSARVVAAIGLAMIAGHQLLDAVHPATPSINGAMGDFRLPPDATWLYALIGLLNVEKYPPSLQYLLMTLGIAALLLAWYQRYDSGVPMERIQRWIHVFGLVPMFFYVLHLFVLHAMALWLARVTGQPSQWLGWGGTFPTSAPEGYGYSLAGVCLAATVAAFLLYFPCRAFARLKARHRTRWLSFV